MHNTILCAIRKAIMPKWAITTESITKDAIPSKDITNNTKSINDTFFIMLLIIGVTIRLASQDIHSPQTPQACLLQSSHPITHDSK